MHPAKCSEYWGKDEGDADLCVWCVCVDVQCIKLTIFGYTPVEENRDSPCVTKEVK